MVTKPVDEGTGALLDDDGVEEEDEDKIVEEELDDEEGRVLVEDGAGIHSTHVIFH